MVAVGAIAGFLAWLTLLDIGKQADLMQRQIDIAINKERARIFIRQVPTDMSFLYPGHERKMEDTDPKFSPYPTEIDKFHVVITNEGESTAFNTSFFGKVSVVDAQGVELLARESEESIDNLKAGANPIVHGIEFFPCIAEEILGAIRDESAILRFFGQVDYETALEPGKGRRTSFSYIWVIEGQWIYADGDGGYIDQPHWKLSPIEANRST